MKINIEAHFGTKVSKCGSKFERLKSIDTFSDTEKMTYSCLSVFIITLLLAFSAVTRADLAASKLLYMYDMGKTCGDVTSEDFFRAYPKEKDKFLGVCTNTDSFNKKVNSLHSSLIYPPHEIQKRVFQQAAETKRKRNECFTEMFDKVLNDESLSQYWMNFELRAWLGYRKAQAWVNTCRENFWNRLEASDIRRYGYEGAWQRKYEKTSLGVPVWKLKNLFSTEKHKQRMAEVCLNEERVSALKSAENLYLIAVPPLNSKQIFDVFDKHHKKSFKLKSNGQPLSDQDWLTLDLPKDISEKIDIQLNPKFYQDIQEQLTDVKNSVQTGIDDLTTQMQSVEDSSANKLSRSMRQELVDEGLVQEVLIEKGFLQKNLMGDYTNHSAAAVCLLSDYQESLKGNVFEMAIFGMIGGGIGLATKLAKAPQVVNKMSSLNKVKLAATPAMVAAFGPSMALQLKQACLQNNPDQIHALNTNQSFLEIKARDELPVNSENYRFRLPKLEFQTEKCDPEVATMIHQQSKINSCIMETILMLGPEKIALPLELLSQ